MVRVAGNIASKTDIGSMEYAVDHLGSPLMVVLGHSKCGVVAATVQGGEVPPNIKAIIERIEPAVGKARTVCPDKSGESLLEEAVTANVWQSMADIYRTVPCCEKK